MKSLRTIARLFLLCGLFGYINSAAKQETDVLKHFWNVAEVVDKIQEKSFRQVDIGRIMEEGLKAMVNKIDAHSSFFTPKSYQDILAITSEEFAGVGISLINKALEDDSLMVIDVVAGGPAEQAGVQSGDKIVEVAGLKLRGLSSDEIVSKLKGNRGTTVDIKVIREKKPLSFTLTRDIIKDRNALSYFFPQQKVFYISLKTFSYKTPQHIEDLLKAAYRRNSQGIILDLRKNTGGVLEAAIDTARLFLPHNSLVTTTRTNTKEIARAYHTAGEPIHPSTVPVFILVDNFTASSSEILAGALQHYAHAHNTLPVFIVGTQTFGKASVQEVISLSNGCALKLTTYLYYLPDNSCLQAKGLTPDLVVKPKCVPRVELKWIEELYGKETSFSNHLTRQEVTGEAEPTPEESSAKKEKLPATPEEIEREHQQSLCNDHQVQTCLTLSNFYTFAHTHAPATVDTHAKALALFSRNVAHDASFPVEPVRL